MEWLIGKRSKSVASSAQHVVADLHRDLACSLGVLVCLSLLRPRVRIVDSDLTPPVKSDEALFD